MPKIKAVLYTILTVTFLIVAFNVYTYLSEYIADQNEKAKCVIGSIEHLFGLCENKYSIEYREQLKKDMYDDWNYYILK